MFENLHELIFSAAYLQYVSYYRMPPMQAFDEAMRVAQVCTSEAQRRGYLRKEQPQGWATPQPTRQAPTPTPGRQIGPSVPQSESAVTSMLAESDAVIVDDGGPPAKLPPAAVIRAQLAAKRKDPADVSSPPADMPAPDGLLDFLSGEGRALIETHGNPELTAKFADALAKYGVK